MPPKGPDLLLIGAIVRRLEAFGQPAGLVGMARTPASEQGANLGVEPPRQQILHNPRQPPRQIVLPEMRGQTRRVSTQREEGQNLPLHPCHTLGDGLVTMNHTGDVPLVASPALYE